MFQFPLPSFLEGVAWPHPALRWGVGGRRPFRGAGRSPQQHQGPFSAPRRPPAAVSMFLSWRMLGR